MIYKGQIYKTRRDIKIIAMTFFAAPFTGGEEATLAADEMFKISVAPVGRATAVYCEPTNRENYERMETMFVEEAIRKIEVYTGFYLCIYIKDIEEGCDLHN